MSPTSPAPGNSTPRRKRRRLAAGALALLGAGAIVLALTSGPEAASDKPAKTAGSLGDSTDRAETTATGEAPTTAGPTTATEGKPPSDAPGGVGEAPKKTGLPAKGAEGGMVRTGTEEEGCFPDMRSYLDAWEATGKEPDPCFTAQPPSEQEQPKNVQRTYNGERF